ncbi:MAG: dehydratase [Acidimicrobiales bacterium mtb01]|nr:MaoC family dehydratase [Actinomycetota bacterium]TEX45690.1 MAG: dehydratase [Acidimicrobiales bacterium mtb01]
MPFTIHIESGKIREYANAVGATDNRYRSEDSPVPPTFLVTARNLWASPADLSYFRELGFDFARLLHGEEEYVFFGRPPRAGDSLEVTTYIADRWEREGRRGGIMRFAAVVSEFRDGNGDLVAEQRSTLIEAES